MKKSMIAKKGKSVKRVKKSELRAFQRYVEKRLAQGDEDFLSEVILDDWREKHPISLDDGLTDEEAIREAIADMEAGDRGQPWEDLKAKWEAELNRKPLKKTKRKSVS